MKKVWIFCCLLITVTTLTQCSDDEERTAPQPINDEDKELPAKWADVTLQVIRSSFPNSPTFTSRCLGYIGLTMYESIVHGNNKYQSLAGKLNGLGSLPLPEKGEEYNWHIALNAGQARILKRLYPHTSRTHLIDSLQTATLTKELATTSVANRSILFGQAIADAIFNWSVSDGGHEGYLRNFDGNYVFPTGAGYWKPASAGQSASPYPLHPFWGSNRTFVESNTMLEVPAIATYSISPSSLYYQYFYEVYQKQKNLTAEEKEIAAWWADDPQKTASPPGHSYNLATIIITTTKSDIFKAAEAYAKVGLAVADAFILCWRCKYTYHSERPFPYIQQYIDKDYPGFWPEPPFPAFTSGHATQSAAVATVLIDIFGNNTSIIDNTYAGRAPDFENIPYKMRTYYTIWETAEECAYSRFLGGIHTRQDNEAGTAQGINIGNIINQLKTRQ